MCTIYQRGGAMNLKMSFPFNHSWQKTLSDSIGDVACFEIDWYWKPFHQAGFETLQFASGQKWPRTEVDMHLSSISCPSVSGKQQSFFASRNVIDENGRVWPLDPETQIRKTWELSGHKMNWDDQSQLPSIHELQQILEFDWEPKFFESLEHKQVSTWLTGEPSLLKKFQKLTPWNQLICLESLIGCAFPKSVLTFQRIYTVNK
jgi:hypothetical protein